MNKNSKYLQEDLSGTPEWSKCWEHPSPTCCIVPKKPDWCVFRGLRRDIGNVDEPNHALEATVGDVTGRYTAVSAVFHPTSVHVTAAAAQFSAHT